MVLLRPSGGAKGYGGSKVEAEWMSALGHLNVELSCVFLPLPLGNAIYMTTEPKPWPQAFRSTLEAFHLIRKWKEDTTQKLLLWLIFLQSCKNAFHTAHGLFFGCQLGTRQNAGVDIKIIDIGVYFNSKGPLSNRDSGGRQGRRNWEWGGREGTGYLILNKRARFVLKISAGNRRKCTGFGDAETGCESELFHLPSVWPWESHSTSLSSGFHLRNQRCVLAFSGGWGPKGNNTQEQAAQGRALCRASHGFSSPYTYLPFKESAGLELTELWDG